MTREQILDDLAYARTLAEEGRHAPLLGGSFLAFWGALNCAAYLGQWALLEERLPDGGGIGFAILWGGYGAIAGIGSALLSLRVGGKPGRTAIGVRAEGAIWRGVAIAMAVISLASIGRMFLDQDALAPNVIMGPAFALFGVALTTVAAMSGEKSLSGFALAAYAAAALLCLFANAPWAYLLAAAASVIVLAVPGIMLLRREPSAIV
jgi:hypothetical protein